MIVYRKHGSVARWENGTLIRVTESGTAIEDGDYFECRPESSSPRAVESSRVLEIVRALRDLQFERLIITHGIAEHECDGRAWTEETERIHISLTQGRLRVLVDSTTRRLDDLFTIAHALQRAEPAERAIDRVRLEPNVTAALLPHLAGRAPSGVRLLQTAGGIDGYGDPILEAEGDWPNFYRPSYRLRPVRMPLNLRLECADTHVDEDLPRAVALLGPVAGLTIRVLVVDGEAVYPATVTVASIRAVAADRIWYPYNGGSFGAAMML
ncbi:MAG TPA: hypothetical protein VF432_28920 [Thermoanaerobaculia bacterium]